MSSWWLGLVFLWFRWSRFGRTLLVMFEDQSEFFDRSSMVYSWFSCLQSFIGGIIFPIFIFFWFVVRFRTIFVMMICFTSSNTRPFKYLDWYVVFVLTYFSTIPEYNKTSNIRSCKTMSIIQNLIYHQTMKFGLLTSEMSIAAENQPLPRRWGFEKTDAASRSFPKISYRAADGLKN